MEQQTATSEILGVIASSPTDIQPVLDTVAENAARITGSDDALIWRGRRKDFRGARSTAHWGPLRRNWTNGQWDALREEERLLTGK